MVETTQTPDLSKLLSAFRESFGGDGGDARLFRAPGRVNLIGEHTDYNDGFVLPMAIDRETLVAARRRSDRLVRVHSLNLNKRAEFDLAQLREEGRGFWLDYVEGVARSLEKGGTRLVGADMVIMSNVPEGAGLSSSAALEISTGYALLSLAEVEIDLVQLALAGQAAEHDYVGAKVGIMDQFIAALGEAGHALLIDCRLLEAAPVPLKLEDYAVVICNSGVKHALASSAYNDRRAECERGVELLRQALPDIRALRDVSVKEFDEYEGLLPEPVRRRVRHVVTENERTIDAAAAFRRGNITEAGRLMTLSHVSLRDDYEVSAVELDHLVEIALAHRGVAGARMTGGGFGGCTVNLVARVAVEDFQLNIKHEYMRRTNRDPAIYIAEASEGASEVMMNAER